MSNNDTVIVEFRHVGRYNLWPVYIHQSEELGLVVLPRHGKVLASMFMAFIGLFLKKDVCKVVDELHTRVFVEMDKGDVYGTDA